MGIEQDRIRGNDAKALLENPIFKDAFTRMETHLDARIYGCDPDNERQTQRVVLAKQILAGIKREIETIISIGEVAEIKLQEVEANKVRKFKR
jgi:hypothetical protein